MTPSVVALCIWVVAGSLIAVLPMRFQMIPGALLLLSGLGLIVWIGVENGWIWSAIALAIFASIFRRPLIALYRHTRAQRGGPGND